MSAVLYHQPDQPPLQDHALRYSQRTQGKAEELLTGEQAGFRPGRSTIEQIFNNGVVKEKHLNNQGDLFHNFIESGMQACDISPEASTQGKVWLKAIRQQSS